MGLLTKKLQKKSFSENAMRTVKGQSHNWTLKPPAAKLIGSQMERTKSYEAMLLRLLNLSTKPNY